MGKGNGKWEMGNGKWTHLVDFLFSHLNFREKKNITEMRNYVMAWHGPINRST